MTTPPTCPLASGFHRKSAFSLIELLTVVALISVLIVGVVPGIRGTLDGINLSGAASLAESQISLAHQTAISRNTPVEVRIYEHDDGTGLAWRAMALVIPASMSGKANDEWITKGTVLPGNIVIEKDGNFSTIVSGASGGSSSGSKVAPWSGQELAGAPGMLKDKKYVAFSFRSDGSTDLPSDKPWCITLKNVRSQSAEGGKPAANFVSLVIDPATGQTLVYQP